MKRRIRRIRRALKRAGLYNAFHITLIAVLLTGFCVILFNVKEPEQQEEKPETTQAEVIQNPETMTQTAESIEDKYKVFNGGAGQMKTYRQKHPYIAQIGYILRYKLQRFTWMFKVKDCRHICLFCEYYDTCRQEGKGK